jgi:hypothetical protein
MTKMRPVLCLLLLAAFPSAVLGADHPALPSPPQGEEGLKDNPSDHYYEGWLRKEGEKPRKAGKPEEAKEPIRAALLQFKGVQKKWPDWKKEMVENRIKMTEEILKSLETPEKLSVY